VWRWRVFSVMPEGMKYVQLWVYLLTIEYCSHAVLWICWISSNLFSLFSSYSQSSQFFCVFVRNNLLSWLFWYHFCLCLVANGPHSIILRSNFKPPLSCTLKGAYLLPLCSAFPLTFWSLKIEWGRRVITLHMLQH
jgi:hypothetical protein